MDSSCIWLKTSPSFQKGIAIINKLEVTKLEQFLRRIVAKIKLQDPEIFTSEERNKLENIFKVDEETLTMAIKTALYLFRKLLKYIFMPIDLKNDLNSLGLNDEKADSFIKVWSAETKSTLNELGSKTIEKDNDAVQFSWKLNAELSSEYRKKCKIPKTYLLIAKGNKNTEIEMTHPEMYSMYLQLEAVQNELDNVMQ